MSAQVSLFDDDAPVAVCPSSKPVINRVIWSDMDNLIEQLQGRYQLPGDEHAVHCLPTSGGADSSALAIVMTLLFPDIQFISFMTDTGVEQPGTMESLKRLEEYLGIHIHIIRRDDGKSLFDIIRDQGGFMPSSNARFCTRMLKTVPGEAFMKTLNLNGEHIYNYVGIRADEERSGLISHDKLIHTEMPFKPLGLVREDIFRILDLTVGVPSMYKMRTRSGCSTCMFQRSSEQMQLLHYFPEAFKEGADFEKLTKNDQERFSRIPPTLQEETGRSLRPGFPLPKRIDVRTANRTPTTKWAKQTRGIEMPGLFEEVQMIDVWVAGDFFIHPGVGDHGCWLQSPSIITYSTTRTGLQRQLHGHYWHRHRTAEVWHIKQAEMEAELKIAMYHLRFPEGIIELSPPDAKTYTWQQGKSLKQMQQIEAYAKRTLEYASMLKQIHEYREAPGHSWRGELRDTYLDILPLITEPVGELVAMDLYDPPKEQYEEKEREVTCLVCSL